MSTTASPAKLHSVKLTPREIETAIAALQNPRGGEIKVSFFSLSSLSSDLSYYQQLNLTHCQSSSTMSVWPRPWV
jgi:hypothetical protein